MRQVNSSAALARSLGPTRPPRYRPRHEHPVVPRDRLTPTDLPLAEESRSVWLAIFERLNVLALFGATRVYNRIAKLTKTEGRNCPLEGLAELIVWCANRGIPEHRVRMALVWLDGIVASVYAGSAHADLAALDLEEQELDNQEDTLATRRHVRELQGLPVTRDELEDEAVVNQRQAATLLTRARELHRRARLAARTDVATTGGALA